ncbi:MAG TPA: hemerythrin domain-containing protein [Hyalangium sp.]|nr:hemerythrin domain-containing protein [Hyalangium sp.]
MLIATLKQQHQELVRLVGEMNVVLERGDEAAVFAVLSSLSQALRTHLALEDREVYPALVRAAEASGDAKMLETARLFADNMQRITESLKDFLARHETSFHLERFRTGWSTLSGVLAKRIESEETTLYPLYEKRVMNRSERRGASGEG